MDPTPQNKISSIDPQPEATPLSEPLPPPETDQPPIPRGRRLRLTGLVVTSLALIAVVVVVIMTYIRKDEAHLAKTIDGLWYYNIGKNHESDAIAIGLLEPVGDFDPTELATIGGMMGSMGKQMIVVFLIEKGRKITSFGGFHTGDIMQLESLMSGELDGWSGKWHLASRTADNQYLLEISLPKRGKTAAHKMSVRVSLNDKDHLTIQSASAPETALTFQRAKVTLIDKKTGKPF